MGYTIAEKILLTHIDKPKSIKPADFIEVKVDLVLGNDITAPLAIEEFRRAGFKKIFDIKRIVLVADHFVPAKDMKSANQAKVLLDFAKEYRIKNYFGPGIGIEHALLPEEGLIFPGDLIVGADSHTCTYGALGAFSFGVGSTDLARAFVDGRCWLKVPSTFKFIYRGKISNLITAKDIILFTIGKIGVDGALGKVMEFCGPIIKGLSMDERFTLCNMAIEAGALTGIIEPDEISFDYIKQFKTKDLKLLNELRSDSDAYYEKIYEYDLSGLQPQVACPHSPANIKSVDKLKDIKIDQVFIGSCTNGRIHDLRIAARILKNRKIKKGLRLIVIPATRKVYLEALKEGLLDIFIKAGGIISPPTCGACLGGHMGVLAEGEVCLSTTNRNFIGRMGDPKSFVYLSSPLVAAASAITGRITHPQEFLK
ncbi:MAG: 3-isopropylmalate dehydratase large subunit [Candidatus Omnitrophica bacterium]|nr:3-isopropylmalate dehydratase large subunit [Candidatus Omnitrophota bacterium]